MSLRILRFLPRLLPLLLLLGPRPGATGADLEVLGTAVIPHVPAREMRFRREVDFRGGARVQVFVRNRGSVAARLGTVRVDGSTADVHVSSGRWSWHDTPSIWDADERTIPAGALVHWTWNQIDRFEDGVSKIVVQPAGDAKESELEARLERPAVQIASVTFLGAADKIYPDRLVLHLRNGSDGPVSIRSLRLWLPESNKSFRYLLARPELAGLDLYPADGVVPPGETGCVVARVKPLPLTYSALELRLEDSTKESTTLWSHLRIKKEVFDIGGGWVSSDKVPGGSLKAEPYLKTLRALHISSGMHDQVPGYTDGQGAGSLYARYPIKMMNRLQPIDRNDRDEVLPRIHAVEFLGEPQYRARSRGSLPPAVLEAFRPYAPSRLATSVTLSDASTWHLWAGLSDYPHYDAYRVTAPTGGLLARLRSLGQREDRLGSPPRDDRRHDEVAPREQSSCADRLLVPGPPRRLARIRRT